MTTTESSAILALQRAMPITRLLDCGMDYADAQELFKETSAGCEWDKKAELLANRQFERAGRAMTRGHLTTAREAQAAGIASLVFAQMALNFDDPRKRFLYGRLAEETHWLADYSAAQMMRIEVPFENAHAVGWLIRPPDQVRGTVLVFGGQSGWGMAYFPIAQALARRGLATLLAEGPGQGETRLNKGIYVNGDITAAYQSFITHIADDHSLGAVGIWGNSIGGLWAAKTAAADDRIRACCVNGAFASPKLLPYRMFTEQAAAMLGNEDPNAIQTNFDRMSFHSGRDRIACPLLVLHGGADPLVQLEDQQPFMDAADKENVTLKTWPDGEHTIYNHATERTAFVADWFADKLYPGGKVI
ncbi:alpha-beta hydrolase superfamily lysophospholipase [Pseudomonas sp. F-14 TE3623]